MQSFVGFCALVAKICLTFEKIGYIIFCGVDDHRSKYQERGWEILGCQDNGQEPHLILFAGAPYLLVTSISSITQPKLIETKMVTNISNDAVDSKSDK